MRSFVQGLVREPLVHFLALGGLIFLLSAVVGPESADLGDRIAVNRADVERLRALYARQWGRIPDERQTRRLVDEHIRQEILFREATKLGLDGDDIVIRNRLVQKMEFLLQAQGEPAEPSDAAADAYLAAHADRYRLPARLRFVHVYFSRSQRGTRADTDAKAMLEALRRALPGQVRVSERGDPFPIESGETLRSADELARVFGAGFAGAVFAQPDGVWGDPIVSPYGVHLVRVTERIDARLPPLSEVRDQVIADMQAEQQRRDVDSAYAALRARYQIVSGDVPISPAGAQAATR